MLDYQKTLSHQDWKKINLKTKDQLQLQRSTSNLEFCFMAISSNLDFFFSLDIHVICYI